MILRSRHSITSVFILCLLLSFNGCYDLINQAPHIVKVLRRTLDNSIVLCYKSQVFEETMECHCIKVLGVTSTDLRLFSLKAIAING